MSFSNNFRTNQYFPREFDQKNNNIQLLLQSRQNEQNARKKEQPFQNQLFDAMSVKLYEVIANLRKYHEVIDNLQKQIKEIREHKMDGYVKEFYADKNGEICVRFISTFGKGKICYENGDEYDGEWKNGKLCGKGIMKYKKGGVYDGEWASGKKNGKGIMKYKNGEVYNGEWKNDDRCGYGTITLKNDVVKKGTWKNDKLDQTQTIEIIENGNVYTGKIKNNEKHGNGIEIMKSGFVFEGEWENGKKNNFGIIKKNNQVILQFWKEGRMVSSLEITTNHNFSICDFNDVSIVTELTDGEKEELICPIMIDRFFPVITSCNHKFCKLALEKYQNGSEKNDNMSCPICRKNIDFFVEDKEAIKILQKCIFKVKDEKMVYDIFIKCYEFVKKWFNSKNVNITIKQSKEENNNFTRNYYLDRRIPYSDTGETDTSSDTSDGSDRIMEETDTDD
jgi:hypothetical protein